MEEQFIISLAQELSGHLQGLSFGHLGRIEQEETLLTQERSGHNIGEESGHVKKFPKAAVCVNLHSSLLDKQNPLGHFKVPIGHDIVEGHNKEFSTHAPFEHWNLVEGHVCSLVQDSLHMLFSHND